MLGFSEYQPVVYLQAKEATSVRLLGITYDQSGYVASYEETITFGDHVVHVKIVTDPALKPTIPEVYQYSAEIDGKDTRSLTLAEWAQTDAKGLVGFAPKGLGGAVFKSRVGFITDFETSLAYDKFGRQRVSKQEFKLDSIRYRIAYSEQTFDKFGRLSSYSAEIRAAN